MIGDVTKEVSASKPTFVSIDNEAYRVYDFGNGKQYRIDRPLRLNVKRKPEGDSHRVLDAQGRAHYVPAGWIGLMWEGKTGETFSF